MGRPVQCDGRVHGVVVAIQRGDGRWLLIRRSANLAIAPGKVCFPGGTVELGEAQHDAVIRESQEELGVDVRPVTPCWRHDFLDKPLTLFGWTAEMADHQVIRPDPGEVAEILWLNDEEAVAHPDAIATNRDFIECLKRSSRRNEPRP